MAVGWTDLQVGQRVGPLGHRIDAMMATRFAAVVGANESSATMPPTLLATDYVLLLHDVLQLGHGLMTRHETQILRPVRVGTEVTVDGTIIDKYERRGRHYWTLRYEVGDAAGPCIVHLVTCTVD